MTSRGIFYHASPKASDIQEAISLFAAEQGDAATLAVTFSELRITLLKMYQQAGGAKSPGDRSRFLDVCGQIPLEVWKAGARKFQDSTSRPVVLVNGSVAADPARIFEILETWDPKNVLPRRGDRSNGIVLFRQDCNHPVLVEYLRRQAASGIGSMENVTTLIGDASSSRKVETLRELIRPLPAVTQKALPRPV